MQNLACLSLLKCLSSICVLVPLDSPVLPVTDEEFVPDPAAKASILSNVGLSHSALHASGKLSLAQRVPVKDAQKPLAACGTRVSTRQSWFLSSLPLSPGA